jgi:hypothetical protein
MTVPCEGGAEDDLALHMGQGGHVGEGIAKVQAIGEIGLVDDGGLGTGDTVEVEREAAAVIGTVAGEIDGSVVGDPIEPGADLAHGGATVQSGPGL